VKHKIPGIFPVNKIPRVFQVSCNRVTFTKTESAFLNSVTTWSNQKSDHKVTEFSNYNGTSHFLTVICELGIQYGGAIRSV